MREHRYVRGRRATPVTGATANSIALAVASIGRIVLELHRCPGIPALACGASTLLYLVSGTRELDALVTFVSTEGAVLSRRFTEFSDALRVEVASERILWGIGDTR